MKRFLGIVKNNIDPDNQKRIQASIIGLTDSIPEAALPWAFPLHDQCVVPDIHSDTVPSKVWVYVDRDDTDYPDVEDYDYNNLYYDLFTEETFLEGYDYSNSETYTLRDTNKMEGDEVTEPDQKESVEYPKNRVIKLSGITIEFDEGNSIFNIIDKTGNYIQMSPDGVIHRTMKDHYSLITGNVFLRAEGDTTFEDKNENKIHITEDQIDISTKSGNTLVLNEKDGIITLNTSDNKGIVIDESTGIAVTDKSGNKITMTASSSKIEDANGNIISLQSGKVDINGGKLTIKT